MPKESCAWPIADLGWPRVTADHSGELSAINFSPHLTNQAGMMSPVYLPGTSFNGSGGGPSGTANWRNTGDAYDRDGNVSLCH
jgi:hypothetical protein